MEDIQCPFCGSKWASEMASWTTHPPSTVCMLSGYGGQAEQWKKRHGNVGVVDTEQIAWLRKMIEMKLMKGTTHHG